MNLLPFAVTLLLILSILGCQQLDECLYLKKDTALFKTYFHGLRSVRNKFEKKAYSRTVAQLKEKEKKEKKKSINDKKKVYFRLKNFGKAKGRVNLYALSKMEDAPKILAAYLKKIYSNIPFFRNSDSDITLLANDILKWVKNNERNKTFKDFLVENLEHKRVFYKMLKGTHVFLEAKRDSSPVGYPCFEAIFHYDMQNLHLVHFNGASCTLLSTLLSNKTAQALIDYEITLLKQYPENTPYPLNKRTLTQFLDRYSSKSKEDVAAFFDFGNIEPLKKPLQFCDNRTNLTVDLGHDY